MALWGLIEDSPERKLKLAIYEAVKQADNEQLKQLLRDNPKIPQDVLQNALEKALDKDDRWEVAGTLLKTHYGAIGTSVLRNVVGEQHVKLFRILSDEGFDFKDYISVSSDNNDNTYRMELKYMLKHLEATRLREERDALKAELNVLKKEMLTRIPASDNGTQPAPPPLDKGKFLSL